MISALRLLAAASLLLGCARKPADAPPRQETCRNVDLGDVGNGMRMTRAEGLLPDGGGCGALDELGGGKGLAR